MLDRSVLLDVAIRLVGRFRGRGARARSGERCLRDTQPDDGRRRHRCEHDRDRGHRATGARRRTSHQPGELQHRFLAASTERVVVPAGATTATFTVGTNALYRAYSGLAFNVTITATDPSDGGAASAVLHVTAQAIPGRSPAAPAAPMHEQRLGACVVAPSGPATRRNAGFLYVQLSAGGRVLGVPLPAGMFVRLPDGVGPQPQPPGRLPHGAPVSDSARGRSVSSATSDRRRARHPRCGARIRLCSSCSAMAWIKRRMRE